MKNYQKLKDKYGLFASWAIWDRNDEKNTKVITNSIDQLNSRYVLLALNISGKLSEIPWTNFHGGKHDRKIKYACNDTILRGCYITDIFKDIPESNSAKIDKYLTPNLIDKNVEFFLAEMKDIALSNTSRFILFGKKNSKISNYFDKYFKPHFSNEVIYYYHYSYYGITDKEWVEGLWAEVGCKETFDKILGKYR